MAERVEKMSGATKHCHGCELWQTIEGDNEPICLNLISWTPDVPADRYCFQPDLSVFVNQLTEGDGNVESY